jgi:glyoxylase-like metal-dependent hydrolase (beta-lactamase superfamily II)
MEIFNLAADSEDFTGNVWKFENDSETVLIDAGEGDVLRKIQELEKIDKIVVTHSHHDHVNNLPEILESFDSEVFAYEPGNLPVEAEEISEEEKIELAGLELKVFHTPGHKDDSICLYSPEEKILFTGDLIFPDGSFGRTDLAEGDRDLLIESIEKISELDVERFYPGHDGAVLEDANQKISGSLENARKRESKY